MTTFLSNRDIYTSVVCVVVLQARDDPRSNFRYGVRHYDELRGSRDNNVLLRHNTRKRTS